jgi:hypothetical protein
MICVALLAATTSGPVQGQEPIRLDTLRTWMAAVSNRGRWGVEDELGTLNMISTGYRRSAAASVQEGLTVSLAHELRAGPNENAIRAMELDYTVAPLGVATATLDQVGLLYHGWAYSHVDALSHFAFDSTFYNGFGLEILTEEGATRLGVDAMGQGIVSRAVLIDVPRLRGVDYLRTDELVTAGLGGAGGCAGVSGRRAPGTDRALAPRSGARPLVGSRVLGRRSPVRGPLAP